jgi:DNA polymerase-3 subunit epsilon
MEFVTIDFETANAQRDSPCEIGLTFVKGGRIAETKSWLIKPMHNRFDYFNTLIHGIRPEHVADKPSFDELWPEIRPMVEHKFLIAHNAGFDMSVLRKTLESYGLPFPNLHYACSYIFAKKVWQGLPGYDLKTLCKVHGIDLVHHRAGADSRATAALALKAFECAGIASMDEFSDKLEMVVGQLFEGGYRASSGAKKTAKVQGQKKSFL